jgi:hypothetical protein
VKHNVPRWQVAKVERYLRGVKQCDSLLLLIEMLRPAALVGEAQPPSLLLLDLLEAEVERRRRHGD